MDTHARASSLPTAVNLGALQIECHEFKQQLLPAPQACIDRIKALLPGQASKQGKECLARMDDTVTQLETVPTNTLEFVKLLTFVHGLEQATADIERQVGRLVESLRLSLARS